MKHPFVDIHTHRPALEGIALLSVRLTDAAQALPSSGVLYSAGIHPWDADRIGGVRDDLLRRLSDASGMAAVGETGLDFACDADRQAQQEIFEAQLAIATVRALPVILHCVRAFGPVMNTLRRYSLPGVIFHCFTGSPEQAAEAVRAGYYLSAGPRSLASTRTVEALRHIPPQHLFLETDDSQRAIGDVYWQAAQALDCGEEELAAIIYDNFKRLFK